MAFFTTAENLQVIKHLKLKPSVISQLVIREQYIYYTLGFGDSFADDVRDILTELNNLETTSANYGADRNSRLIQADTLKWSEGGAMAALNERKSELKQQLISLLDIEHLVLSFGRGTANNYSTAVYRS